MIQQQVTIQHVRADMIPDLELMGSWLDQLWKDKVHVEGLKTHKFVSSLFPELAPARGHAEQRVDTAPRHLQEA